MRMSTASIDHLRNRIAGVAAFLALLLIALAFAARPVMAQATAPAAAPASATASAPAGEPATAPAAATVAEASAPATPAATGSYVPMKPTPGIGMPVDGGLDVQKQFSPTGRYAFKFHYAMLWVMGIISVFVLGLLIYVMWRFRAKANPVPSRNTHNTLLEVAWTIVPVLVLVAIAIPSISLLSQQYRSPPKDAVTIKVTGYQWYWGYSYPDNGDFEVISNMLPEGEAEKRGEPSHLGVDNRMVVPAGVPLRIQVTAADVIHSFAVPSLWFKIDAVPGRLNERVLLIEKPGVYYGQCSELCGVRHGYMPIAIEALPMDRYRAWIREQGGTFADEAAPAAAAATPAAAPAAPASAPPAAATPAAGGTVAPASPAPAA